MKKMWVAAMLCLVLTGCGTVQTFETLGQIQHQTDEIPAMGTVSLTLPQSASKEALASGDNTLYHCDGYTLMLQTMTSGDFSRTVQSLSGFRADDLTVMETRTGAYQRYDWVWTAAGEGGDVLCRAAVLDDGSYHYCLCVMAPAQEAGRLQPEWAEVFHSFGLSGL